MKVISLWQPFASLIFVGVKGYETRSFVYPKSLEGQRIAIHATAKFTPASMISDDLDALCVGYFGEDYRQTLPRSAILGTVCLSGAHKAEDLRDQMSPAELCAGDWSDGRIVWNLRDVERLVEPLHKKGNQGWWSWEP